MQNRVSAVLRVERHALRLRQVLGGTARVMALDVPFISRLYVVRIVVVTMPTRGRALRLDGAVAVIRVVVDIVSER